MTSDRIKRVCRIWKEKRPAAECILVVNVPDENFFYLTGLELQQDRYDRCFALLHGDGALDVYVYELEYEAARTFSEGMVHPILNSGGMMRNVADRLKNFETVGVVAEKIPYAYATKLEKSGARMLDVSDVFSAARLVKTRGEIGKIKTACDMTTKCLDAVSSHLGDFGREVDFAAEIARSFAKQGCEPAFPPICAADSHSAFPHYAAGFAKPRNSIMLDIGARYRSYCADMTRCIAIKNTPWFKKYTEIVMDAYGVALEKIKDGCSGAEVHAAAEKIINKAGFRFIQSIGHSVGLAAHDDSMRNIKAFEPGMTVAIEPAVYKLGVGGVRYENTLLVTKNGVKVLTKT